MLDIVSVGSGVVIDNPAILVNDRDDEAAQAGIDPEVDDVLVVVRGRREVLLAAATVTPKPTEEVLGHPDIGGAAGLAAGGGENEADLASHS